MKRPLSQVLNSVGNWRMFVLFHLVQIGYFNKHTKKVIKTLKVEPMSLV
ncbi:hypothetical protein [Leptospira stimsonii]|nr:hypothetical protein [Leptospira stimsonii]